MQLNNSFRRLEVSSAMYHWYIERSTPDRPRQTKKSPKNEKQKDFFHSKKIQLQMDANAKPFAMIFANNKTSRSILKVLKHERISFAC